MRIVSWALAEAHRISCPVPAMTNWELYERLLRAGVS